MITLRRGQDRHHEQRGSKERWRTFSARAASDPLSGGFGALESLDETRLPPGARAAPMPRRAVEMLTYVWEGALAYQGTHAGAGMLQAGEFQRMRKARGAAHREANASPTDWAHVFKLWLRPDPGSQPASHEQKRFSAAERRAGLCLVVSPDGERGSLRISQQARLYSALLFAGQHVIHELLPGRSAWLHLVQGELSLGEQVLISGDGAGVSLERALSFTARGACEVLLLELGAAPRAPSNGSVQG